MKFTFNLPVLSLKLFTLLLTLLLSGKTIGRAQDNNDLVQVESNRQTNLYPDLRINKKLFKQFLKNPYPVKDVVFDIPAGHPTKNPTNIFVFDGCLQDDTYFLHSQDTKNLTKAGVKNFSTGEISGQSSDGTHWFINGAASHGNGGDVDITSNNYADPAALTKGKFRSIESLVQLHGACWFGLLLMVPHSIVWHEDNFDILWHDSQWPHNTNVYTVNGEVLDYTNNLPKIIRLKSNKWPSTYKWVDYHYEYDFSNTNRFYPINIWANLVFVGDIEVQGATFNIPKIEFGKADLPEGGYQAKTFLQANVPVSFHMLMSISNNTYLVENGVLTKIDPPVRPDGILSPRIIIRVLLITLFILPAGVLFAAVIKNKQKQTNKQKYEDNS
jgi:hypothetical protein